MKSPKECRAEFLKMFNGIRYTRDRHTLFDDFLTLAFCALAKGQALSNEKAEELEARYMAVVARYKDNDLDIIRNVFPKLMGMIQLALMPGSQTDFLGELYHELELHNKNLGQFFTPFHLSQLCARFSIQEFILRLKSGEKKWFTMSEPAAGAGGMILAAAHEIEAVGIDFSKALWVEAIDLSDMAFKMCYIQLSMRGVAGVVRRGNSLSREMFESHYTPMGLAFLARNGDPFKTAKAKVNRERTRKINRDR